MARFCGVVGYGHTVEARPGIFEDVITEKLYYGDVVRDTRQFRESEQSVNNNLSVQNSISIVADGYANENVYAIRYVEWAGAKWTVASVEVQRPRLLLRIGEVYNGQST